MLCLLNNKFLSRVSQEVSDEMIKILNSVQFKEEFSNFLRSHKFKINIEINPKDKEDFTNEEDPTNEDKNKSEKSNK